MVGIIVSAWTNWPCMMGVQWHLQWLEDIVIPFFHLLDKSLQATNSSFIFILMGLAHQVDSNWYTMQQVRILVTLCLEQRKRHTSWNFFKAWLVTYFDLRTIHKQRRNFLGFWHPPFLMLAVCVLTIWYFRPLGNAGLQSPRDLPSP